jgi:ABC-type transport system involved in multi-copper enzyme maturation permease subunit
MKILIIMKYEMRPLLKSMMALAMLIGFSVIFNLILYDPNTFGEITMELPLEVLALVGGSMDMSTPENFHFLKDMGVWWLYYGFYTVYQINNLIGKDIEEKSVDLYLSKPTARKDYLLARYFMVALAALILITLTFGFFTLAIIINPRTSLGDIQWGDVIIAYVWIAIATIAIESLCLMCIGLAERRTAKALGFLVLIGGIFIGEYWFLLAEEVHFIRYFSVFHYLNAGDVVRLGMNNVENMGRDIFVLVAVSIISVVIAIWGYRKKDIPV